MTEQTTTLPAIQQNFPLAMMADQGINLPEIVEDNLGGDTLSAFDLERITVPSGGLTSWVLEDGEEPKALEGVIIAMQKARSYWHDDTGTSEGTPPDCVSHDLIHGHGEPGGLCKDCPLNVFGSGVNGHSKACKETEHIYLLREGILPVVLQIPPSSLQAFKKYKSRLIGKGLSINGVVTEFTLKQSVSRKSGHKYSEVCFRHVGVLADEHFEMVKGYKESLKQVIAGGEVTNPQ